MDDLVTPQLADVFKDRRVFVTGHTGFKGSWLSIWLHSLGARVIGYSLSPPTSPSNFESSRVSEILTEDCTADVRDVDTLSRMIDQTRPEVVFHLAAQSLVLEGYKEPLETTATNALGTANLLESVRRAGRPCCVIIVTSDKCYGTSNQPWGHREDDRLGGDDPYSASKAAAEILTSSFRTSFFNPDRLSQHGVMVATVRAGNVIGGGDWSSDRIIPDAVRALERNRPVVVRNPESIRPWQHVVEPLGGYLLLASRMLTDNDPQLCSAWNFGPARTDEQPVRHLVEGFLEGWGGGSWNAAEDRSAPAESSILRLSIERAAAHLDWHPLWHLSETVGRTARWYRTFAQDSSRCMRTECMVDIADYQKARKPDND
jgi:CDP-glucose 4,6-dehydratase